MLTKRDWLRGKAYKQSFTVLRSKYICIKPIIAIVVLDAFTKYVALLRVKYIALIVCLELLPCNINACFEFAIDRFKIIVLHLCVK